MAKIIKANPSDRLISHRGVFRMHRIQLGEIFFMPGIPLVAFLRPTGVSLQLPGSPHCGCFGVSRYACAEFVASRRDFAHMAFIRFVQFEMK